MHTGDLVVIDNLSVCHKADASAHVPVDSDIEQSKLRILHRSTVAGWDHKPFDPVDGPLKGIRHLDIFGRNPLNQDGVWIGGGIGFRWDDSIKMRN